MKTKKSIFMCLIFLTQIFAFDAYCITSNTQILPFDFPDVLDIGPTSDPVPFATSSNGSNIYVAYRKSDYSLQVYRSIDSGENFAGPAVFGASADTFNGAPSIATDSIGEYVFITYAIGTNETIVLTSSDFGNTFSETFNSGVPSFPGDFFDIATSDSGQFVVASWIDGANKLVVIRSDAFGEFDTFTFSIFPSDFAALETAAKQMVMSSDGKNVIISSHEDSSPIDLRIIRSTNFGINFDNATPNPLNLGLAGDVVNVGLLEVARGIVTITWTSTDPNPDLAGDMQSISINGGKDFARNKFVCATKCFINQSPGMAIRERNTHPARYRVLDTVR